jgi:hypothetical protein
VGRRRRPAARGRPTSSPSATRSATPRGRGWPVGSTPASSWS